MNVTVETNAQSDATFHVLVPWDADRKRITASIIAWRKNNPCRAFAKATRRAR